MPDRRPVVMMHEVRAGGGAPVTVALCIGCVRRWRRAGAGVAPSPGSTWAKATRGECQKCGAGRAKV